MKLSPVVLKIYQPPRAKGTWWSNINIFEILYVPYLLVCENFEKIFCTMFLLKIEDFLINE